MTDRSPSRCQSARLYVRLPKAKEVADLLLARLRANALDVYGVRHIDGSWGVGRGLMQCSGGSCVGVRGKGVCSGVW